jgi:hypothetical protein
MVSRRSKALLKRGPATTLVLAVAVFCWSLPAPAQAAPIGVTYSMDVTLILGDDALGLDGASMTLTVLFDDADTYDLTGLPDLAAASDSLTISGSGSVDGTYASTHGARFLPTFDGQFYGQTGP